MAWAASPRTTAEAKKWYGRHLMLMRGRCGFALNEPTKLGRRDERRHPREVAVRRTAARRTGCSPRRQIQRSGGTACR